MTPCRPLVVGLIYMIYLYRTHPGRVTDVGLVHLDALEEDAASATAD